MAHAGSTLWQEIQHRLHHRAANSDAIELLILDGIAAVMAIQDDLETRMEKVMTAAQSVVDTATQLITSLGSVLTQFETEVGVLQANNPGVNIDGLSAAIAAGQTALTTAQQQVASWTPPADTTTPPADGSTPPADGSTPPADGSTTPPVDTTT
jgi:hypothetical protein